MAALAVRAEPFYKRLAWFTDSLYSGGPVLLNISNIPAANLFLPGIWRTGSN